MQELACFLSVAICTKSDTSLTYKGLPIQIINSPKGRRRITMDQNLRASIQTSTFYYFLIIVALVTISQLATMMVIVFADISGKESVVAASVIGPCLVGAFGIIRLMTNMQYIVSDMDDAMKATTYGAGISAIQFPILKLVFALIFVVIAVVQLMAIY